MSKQDQVEKVATVIGNAIAEVDSEINDYLKKGYDLRGYLTVTFMTSKPLYAQQMVKYKEEKFSEGEK